MSRDVGATQGDVMASFRDVSGLAVSSTNGEAVELYNRVSFGYITARFSTVSDLYRAIELDGSFVLAHCLMAYFMLGDLNPPDHPKVKPHLDALRSTRLELTGREKRYMHAILTYASGSLLDASVELEDLLLHYPTDGLALRMNNDSYIVLRENERMRNMLARALPHWSQDMPLYPFMLALYAYALEECNHKDKGEATAKQALAMDSNVPLATHALAHIMEEEHDASSGVEFLTSTRSDWCDSTFGGHITWHLTLYHLELGDTAAVLREFDSVLLDRATASDKFGLLDASSLLWRLNCLGVDPGEDRWARVTSAMETHLGNHRSPWFDSHIMMSLARGKVTESAARLALAQGMLKSMEEFSKNDDIWTCKISQRLGVPICTALLAFGQEQYDDVLSLLVPLRYDTISLGGSWAQRQVYSTTMIQAAVRAGDTAMALGLVAELKAQKPKNKSLQVLFDGLMLQQKKSNK